MRPPPLHSSLDDDRFEIFARHDHRAVIRQRADFVGGHRVFVAAAGMVGDADTARGALQELRRAQPNISLAWLQEIIPIKRDADREHYLDGFRRAGLT